MAYRSSTRLAGSSSASAAVAVGPGAAVDDIAVVGIYLETANAITPPSGFLQYADLNTGAPGSVGRLVIFWKRLTAADTGTYTFTWTGSVWREAVCVLYSGRVTSGDPFTASGSSQTTTGTTNTVPALTAATGDDLVGIATNFNGGAWTAPSGMTERQDGSSDITLDTADNVPGGSTGSKTFTCATSGASKAFLGALAVAAAGGTDATFSTTAGNAAADGGTGSFAGDAAFSTTAADAAADGGSSSFSGTATFSTTASDGAADGGSTTMTGDGRFSTTAGDATAEGGTGSFNGGTGAVDATFGTTVGDVSASGGSSTFSGDATFATTVGTSPADGGTGSFSGSAMFSTTAGDAAAAGGTGSFTTTSAGSFTTTVGDAQAGGGSSTFVGTATFSTTRGDAAADGGTGSFFVGAPPVIRHPRATLRAGSAAELEANRSRAVVTSGGSAVIAPNRARGQRFGG